MYLIIKRIFDIVFSLLLLVLLMPFFLLIVIVLKIDNISPIIYKQKRSGKNNTVFVIYKFKTMETEDINYFCHFLRKTGLDELPQIINILKGEMSFVGPRPWILDYSKYFNEKQKKRLNVLPGLTGLAQINNSNINIFEKINIDCYYVENLSFLLDLKIIIKTFKFLLTNKKQDYISIEEEIEMLKKQID